MECWTQQVAPDLFDVKAMLCARRDIVRSWAHIAEVKGPSESVARICVRRYAHADRVFSGNSGCTATNSVRIWLGPWQNSSFSGFAVDGNERPVSLCSMFHGPHVDRGNGGPVRTSPILTFGPNWQIGSEDGDRTGPNRLEPVRFNINVA